MTQLVILVVAAAWLAVLIPPMLQSRVQNRPNSSVTDFRRQLDKLQSTAAPRPGMRVVGRPLAPAANGRQRVARPERPVLRSGVSPHQPRTDVAPIHDNTIPVRQPVRTGGGRRVHGDPTGGQSRPARSVRSVEDLGDGTDPYGRVRHAEDGRSYREHTAPHGMRRVADSKRRRANVLFGLVVVTAATLFLAATTASSVMFYAFALSFLALIGYLYLLAQANQRSSYDGWMERH